MKIRKHVVIDIETLGVNPNAPIVQIAAVVVGFQDVPHFNTLVDMEDAVRYGKPDASTIKFWIAHGGPNCTILQGSGGLPSALIGLNSWFRNFVENDLRVWTRGPSFDAIILREAYKACGLVAPWHFWQERDHRTIEELAAIPYVHLLPQKKHDALADATSQAAHINVCMTKLGLSND